MGEVFLIKETHSQFQKRHLLEIKHHHNLLKENILSELKSLTLLTKWIF